MEHKKYNLSDLRKKSKSINKTIYNTEKVIKTGKTLPRGVKAEVSKRLKLSPSMIYRIFTGDYIPNNKLLNTVLSVTNEVLKDLKKTKE